MKGAVIILRVWTKKKIIFPAVIGGTQIKADSNTVLGEQIEVIKVYLERDRQQDKELQSVTMLNDEVSHIQEVRYCLKTLREQMAARHNNNNKSPTNGFRVHLLSTTSPISSTSMDMSVFESQEEQESLRLRELTKRLYAELQEAEKRHQEDREALKAENRELLWRLEEQNEHLQQAQRQAEGQSQCTEKLQKLLEDLKLENGSLHEKIAAGEAELRAPKKGDDVKRFENRNIQLTLQNSRIMMEGRERLIRDLEEKVGFLEAENREMRDQIEFCLGDQTHSSGYSESQIVYSKPLTPTSPKNKSLPFIKVIEIKT
ncbi:Tuftelin [Bagarius yarrelli]|uniref:Tuftelin n=1 Tax=Bagarius yarrelli TaxID=175774 RepID=A0A556U8P6_BAGYA|nr:Tuftelin [Bagarius yarrelli]